MNIETYRNKFVSLAATQDEHNALYEALQSFNDSFTLKGSGVLFVEPASENKYNIFPEPSAQGHISYLDKIESGIGDIVGVRITKDGYRTPITRTCVNDVVYDVRQQSPHFLDRTPAAFELIQLKIGRLEARVSQFQDNRRDVMNYLSVLKDRPYRTAIYSD